MALAEKIAEFKPGEAPEGASVVIRAWNLMDGIDWTALPFVCALLGVQDVEWLLAGLCAIRDSQRRSRHV